MATYTVYSTTAGTLNETLVKESVQDLITNLYPLDTPLQQILEKVPMNNVFTEQPVDTFNTITRTSAVFDASSALATTHAKPEGFTYSTGTAQHRRSSRAWPRSRACSSPCRTPTAPCRNTA